MATVPSFSLLLLSFLLLALPTTISAFLFYPNRLSGRAAGAVPRIQLLAPAGPSSSTPSYGVYQHNTVLYARRRRKGDSDADYERFDLDELRVEKRFEEVEEIDPEMFRPSKMEYYVPPPVEEIEQWDVTDTRYIAIGLDRDGDEIFREQRLPNCYLHLAWARRSYLDQRSPVSVWWDYALVREDLQGNRGNLFGMNASSASLVKAFVELDPYKKLGVYKSLKGYRWNPLKDPDLLYAPRVQFAVVALDKADALPLRMATREAHLAYMRSSGRVVTAGPLFDLDAEDGSPVGSLVVFNAEDTEEARAFIADDPYVKAGLFGETFLTQLAELDVTGQHLDRQWEKYQMEENHYDPVHDLMVGWGLIKGEE
ncbi:ycii-related domain protein [Nannochloropsis oceanica]